MHEPMVDRPRNEHPHGSAGMRVASGLLEEERLSSTRPLDVGSGSVERKWRVQRRVLVVPATLALCWISTSAYADPVTDRAASTAPPPHPRYGLRAGVVISRLDLPQSALELVVDNDVLFGTIPLKNKPYVGFRVEALGRIGLGSSVVLEPHLAFVAFGTRVRGDGLLAVRGVPDLFLRVEESTDYRLTAVEVPVIVKIESRREFWHLYGGGAACRMDRVVEGARPRDVRGGRFPPHRRRHHGRCFGAHRCGDAGIRRHPGC